MAKGDERAMIAVKAGTVVALEEEERVRGYTPPLEAEPVKHVEEEERFDWWILFLLLFILYMIYKILRGEKV